MAKLGFQCEAAANGLESPPLASGNGQAVDTFEASPMICERGAN